MSLCSSAQVMRHEQYDRLIGCPPQLACNRCAVHPSGIMGYVAGHLEEILRMLGKQCLHATLLAYGTIRSEAHFSSMKHKRVQSQDISPPMLGDAHAEIILLTVALAKSIRIEQPECIQALPLDIHAETNASGYLDRTAGIDCPASIIQFDQTNARLQFAAPRKIRVAADRSIVRQWRDGRHLLIGISLISDAIKPVARDLGIAIEEKNIILLRHGHRYVYCANKAEVVFVDQILEPITLSRLGEIVEHFLLG